MRWGVADIDYGVGDIAFGEIVPINNNIATIFSDTLTLGLASNDNISINISNILQAGFVSSDMLQIGISDVAGVSNYIGVITSIAPQANLSITGIKNQHDAIFAPTLIQEAYIESDVGTAINIFPLILDTTQEEYILLHTNELIHPQVLRDIQSISLNIDSTIDPIVSLFRMYVDVDSNDLLQSTLVALPYIESDLSSQETITINISDIIVEMETNVVENLLVSIADVQIQRDLFTNTLLHLVLDDDAIGIALVDTVIKRFDGTSWISVSPCVYIKQSDGTWQQIIVKTKQYDGSWM